jgi:hypothetical protein
MIMDLACASMIGIDSTGSWSRAGADGALLRLISSVQTDSMITADYGRPESSSSHSAL